MTLTASLDLGTNSTRVLIIGADGKPVAREMTITHLGQGVGSSGRLHDDAIRRTTDCLRTYKTLIESHGVAINPDCVRAVTTSAARDAQNRDVFLDACADALGVRPEVISGAEEGRLSFLGATASLAARKNAYGEDELDLVFDIGGGSTEFVVGVAGRSPLGAISVDAGCVRFNERYLHEFDPPGPEALSSAVSVMRAHLDDVDRALPDAKRATRAIGLAGSVSTVATIELGRDYEREVVHHFHLTRAAAEDVFRTVATERREDRAANPGLEPARVDTIVAGALIVVTIMRHFNLDEVLVSEDDILDGVVAELRAKLTA